MRPRRLPALLLAALLSPSAAGATSPAPPLRIGIGAMISPVETFKYYDAMLAYVGRQLGRKVEMVRYTTYDEMDAALERLDLDFAFICSGPYVRDHAKFGAELLAAPQAHGAAFYYSYLLVPKESPARSLADLRGKRFAFTDPKSNTGRLVPTFLVVKETGLSPEAFFGSVKFTWSHDRSIDEVNAGQVDGASVDSLIYDYLAKRTPARVRNVRILAKSIPYGIPPVVSTRAADPRVKARLRDVVLGMHQDPEGRRILEGIGIDRFIVPKDSDYDAVREMEKWLNQHPELRAKR
ncbi:MAG TPA: phosphate/phosphite/phosphonate ABC transporter substrate-binding protein [Anaeromyxobacteraceae bacterium]|nr:phosphate/phosphite/phosphonate ABC transporter substrate-binding protein [Anaeromyxobacteraceae bacterium]